jgi:peptidoglycan/LPS O-acetylase OafA/YrhL
LRIFAELLPQWPHDPRLAFETVADGLATGCLLAAYRERLFSYDWYRRLLQWKYFNLLPIGALLIQGLLPPPLLWAAVIAPAMNLVIAATIDRYIRYPDTPTGRLLNSRPFVLVGTWSYSLYLWQQLFLNDAHPMMFPLNIVCIVLAAMASYYWIEQPFLRLGKRRAAAPAPAAT